MRKADSLSAFIRSAFVAVCGAALSACAAHSVEHSGREATVTPQIEQTAPAAGGTTGAGTSSTTSGPSSTGPLESSRGSVPPGKDRAGGEPSSGAIIDPTGAATRVPVTH